MKIKNGLVFCSMFFFCSTIIFGMQPQEPIFCPIVNLENGKIKWNQTAGSVRQSKLKRFEQGIISENDTVYEVNITKVRRRDANEYHLAVLNSPVDYAVKLSQQNIEEITNQFQQDKPIFFEIYDPVSTGSVKAKVKITLTDCKKALNAEPITIEQKYPNLPHDPVQAQQPPKPQKAVSPQPKQHPVQDPQPIDDSAWKATFIAPQKTVIQFEQNPSIQQKDGSNFFQQLSEKDSQALYQSLIGQNNEAKTEYYFKLATVLEKKLVPLNFKDLSPEDQQKTAGRFARKIIKHYWRYVECNDDLDRPTFEEYISTLQVIMRRKDHKNTVARDSEGPLFKTFSEINNTAGPIIKDHQDLLASLSKQKEQWNKEAQEEKNRIDQEIFDHKKSAIFVPLMQTAFSLASQEVGHMVASGLLSLIPNPELEKELTDLKEEIAKQEKKLKENILENNAKKHTDVLFEQSEDRKKLLDGYNDQRKKPTQMELLQSLKDRHAKKCK